VTPTAEARAARERHAAELEARADRMIHRSVMQNRVIGVVAALALLLTLGYGFRNLNIKTEELNQAVAGVDASVAELNDTGQMIAEAGQVIAEQVTRIGCSNARLIAVVVEEVDTIQAIMARVPLPPSLRIQLYALAVTRNRLETTIRGCRAYQPPGTTRNGGGDGAGSEGSPGGGGSARSSPPPGSSATSTTTTTTTTTTTIPCRDQTPRRGCHPEHPRR
jgi:uncharacterized membrane protein YgcG